MSHGVGVVLRSEYANVKAGDHVWGILGMNYWESSELNSNSLSAHAQYTIQKDLSLVQVLENPNDLPWSTFIGVLGMPGTICIALFSQTAFSSSNR